MYAKCNFLISTLGDANFMREQVVQDYKNRNIYFSVEEITCLGVSSGNRKYCDIKGEATGD